MENEKELLEMYIAESEEKFLSIENTLKALEANPGDKVKILELYRDFHSLKGTSRMLGFFEITQLIHLMEEKLTPHLTSSQPLALSVVALFTEVVDALELIVQAKATNSAPSIDFDKIKSRLEESCGKAYEDLVGSIATVTKAAEEIQQPKTEAEKTIEAEQKIAERLSKYSMKSSYVQVPSKSLDMLIAQAGDLTVTKNRMGNFYDRLEDIKIEYEKLRFVLNKYNISEEDENQIVTIASNINEIQQSCYEPIHRFEMIISEIGQLISRLGLVYLSKLFMIYQKMIGDLAKLYGKKIETVVTGQDVAVDKKIVEELKDPLMHLLRNAILHGIENPEERISKGKPAQGTITFSITQMSSFIVIEVTDDGRGISIDKIKEKVIEKKIYTPEELDIMPPEAIRSLIFLPGFSTSKVDQIGGRGIGLDVVRENVEKLYGTVEVDSTEDEGCRFSIKLPMTYVTNHVILIKADAFIFAIPIELIDSCFLIEENDVMHLDNCEVILIGEQILSVHKLNTLLGISNLQEIKEKNKDKLSCLIVKGIGQKFVILVDEIFDEQNVVVTPVPKWMKGTKGILGYTILKNGDVCNVLNPSQIILDLQQAGMLHIQRINPKTTQQSRRKKVILIVDDSYVVRSILRKTLETNKEYDVIEAVDGLDAFSKFQDNPKIEAIISDVDMPNMDGFELCKKIRHEKPSKAFPIILLSAHNEQKDIKKGLAMGANVFIIKSEASMNAILETLNEILRYGSNSFSHN